MPRHIKYSKAERQLAARGREIAPYRDLLYHGTGYAKSILQSGVLLSFGGRVCLTRSAEVAAYWALMPRETDESRASILVLNRQSLQRCYEIKANPEAFWHSKTVFHDEAEEEIWDDIINVGDHLVGIVLGPPCLDTRPLTPEVRRTFKRAHRMEIQARLKKLGMPRKVGAEHNGKKIARSSATDFMPSKVSS